MTPFLQMPCDERDSETEGTYRWALSNTFHEERSDQADARGVFLICAVVRFRPFARRELVCDLAVHDGKVGVAIEQSR